MGNIWHKWNTHPGCRGVITTRGLALLRSGGLVLLMPWLEARRAVPGPQILLWLAQDLLLWLAWHALSWSARPALLPELEAQVQQGCFANERRTKRSLSRS